VDAGQTRTHLASLRQRSLGHTVVNRSNPAHYSPDILLTRAVRLGWQLAEHAGHRTPDGLQALALLGLPKVVADVVGAGASTPAPPAGFM
jgi:hypothetical protein